MRALRNKWSSRRGASILLALLFMLVAMLVASSVLMAAASNAGKIKGNKEEHQKYLTVSSALTTLAGELENMEYTGSYGRTEAGDPDNGDVTDEDGHVTDVYGIVTYEREEGTLTGWDYLKGVLPLQDNLDYVLSVLFNNKPDDGPEAVDSDTLTDTEGNVYEQTTYRTYKWNGGWTGAEPSRSYTLTLTADPTGAGVEGGIGDTVKITVKITYPNLTGKTELSENIRIDLEAVLPDPDDPARETNRMYARLESVSTLQVPEKTDTTGNAGTLKWKLVSISKIEGDST